MYGDRLLGLSNKINAELNSLSKEGSPVPDLEKKISDLSTILSEERASLRELAKMYGNTKDFDKMRSICREFNGFDFKAISHGDMKAYSNRISQVAEHASTIPLHFQDMEQAAFDTNSSEILWFGRIIPGVVFTVGAGFSASLTLSVPNVLGMSGLLIFVGLAVTAVATDYGFVKPKIKDG